MTTEYQLFQVRGNPPPSPAEAYQARLVPDGAGGHLVEWGRAAPWEFEGLKKERPDFFLWTVSQFRAEFEPYEEIPYGHQEN